MTTEFLGIMIRILQENYQKILINIQIKKLDDYGILMKFQRDFDQNSFKELDDQRIFCEIFQGFWSELWWALVSSNLDSSRISSC